ncbi:GNAT family N-acetyltransferase [Clostridium beijerinckii]|nr:GNAT family N-acetyltransferase [Clostridium beijerinckii]
MNEIKKDKNKFYIGENSQNALAEITFVPEGESKIIVNHTYVSESLRGQGIALKLVEKVIEYARQENIKIIPLCSYVEKVMTRNDKYKDVLSEK